MNFKPISFVFSGIVCGAILAICGAFSSISQEKTTVLGADLVVVGRKVEITRLDDTHAIYTFTIKNIGRTTANLVQMKITTLFSHGTFGLDENLNRVFTEVATDFYTNMRVIDLPNPNTLAPDATVEVRHRLTVASAFPSRIGIKIILDPTEKVKESNNNNNEAVELTNNNTMLDGDADLYFTKGGVLNRINDHSFKFSVGIYNDGNVAIDLQNMKISTELHFISLNGWVSLPTGLFFYKDMRYDSPPNPLILEPGSGTRLKMKIATTEILPHTINLALKLDAENVVAEFSEDNNSKVPYLVNMEN